jgi:hypothetical protein
MFVNKGVDDGLIGFSYDVLVECKTQGSAVNSHTIGWFAQQLRRRGIDWGILVALSGITGDPINVTAAHREVERSAVEGQRILVLTASEIRGLRSAAHLVALLQFKREAAVGAYGAKIASAEELLELNPDRRVRVPRRGWMAMEEAILRMRRQALGELLDAAAAMPDLTPAQAIGLAESRLAELSGEARQHEDDPDHDPMWLVARSMLVHSAAALVHILDPTPRTEEERRHVGFETEVSAPQRLRAHPGARLWELLTDFYLDETRRPETHARAAAVYALLTMAVDELIAIDDIEPPDAWDHLE